MTIHEIEDKAWHLLTNNSYLALAANNDRAGLQVQTGFSLAILALAKSIEGLEAQGSPITKATNY